MAEDMTQETETLHLYLIGENEYVAAKDEADAWRIWEGEMGCSRSEDGGDALDAIEDSESIKVWCDQEGRPTEHGAGQVVARTAAEWAEQLGRGICFHDYD